MKMYVLGSLAVILSACSSFAQDLEFATWLSDHAVLQREQPIVIVGFGVPGATVEVEFGEHFSQSQIDKHGAWRVSLPAMDAGGPFELVARSEGSVLRLRDVLIGDVWIAGGQSNMEWPVHASDGVAAALRASESMSMVRFASVPHVLARQPVEIGRGEVDEWQVISPETAETVSAVAFHFASEVWRETGVPIGIFEANWGGSAIEPWIPREGYEASDRLSVIRDRHPWFSEEQDQRASIAEFEAVFDDSSDELAEWSFGRGDGWRAITAPGQWESVIGARDGVGWYVREIDVPASAAGKEGVLSLAMVDDYDRAYVNGVLVGRTGRDQADSWRMPRVYSVPKGAIVVGINTIAVQVLDTGGGGGIHGDDDDLSLSVGDVVLPLAGEWRLRLESQSRRWALLGPRPAWMPANRLYGGGMWNGMLAPHVPMGVRGAIWYQGEGNAARANEYRELFEAMAESWRGAFENPELSFFAVQLASFRERAPEPTDGGWAWIREAQAASREIEGAEMVLALDVGDANDIHPRDKETVGRRLAAAVLSESYGIPKPYRGPRMSDVRFVGGTAFVEFDYASGLQTTDGKAPLGFAIAGEEMRFVWADARVGDDGFVEVWSTEIDHPVALRYAWESNPAINLINEQGLPAEPFRTDRQPRK